MSLFRLLLNSIVLRRRKNSINNKNINNTINNNSTPTTTLITSLFGPYYYYFPALYLILINLNSFFGPRRTAAATTKSTKLMNQTDKSTSSSGIRFGREMFDNPSSNWTSASELKNRRFSFSSSAKFVAISRLTGSLTSLVKANEKKTPIEEKGKILDLENNKAKRILIII